MDKPTQELGWLERFCTQQPFVTALLTAVFMGLLMLVGELLTYPINRKLFNDWWFSTSSLEYIPLLTFVLYVIFSRFKEVKNNWDRRIDNMFCNRPVLTSGLFSLIAGSSTMIRDLIAVFFWNSSFHQETFIDPILVTLFSFVICYISARLMTSFIKERGRLKSGGTDS